MRGVIGRPGVAWASAPIARKLQIHCFMTFNYAETVGLDRSGLMVMSFCITSDVLQHGRGWPTKQYLAKRVKCELALGLCAKSFSARGFLQTSVAPYTQRNVTAMIAYQRMRFCSPSNHGRFRSFRSWTVSLRISHRSFKLLQQKQNEPRGDRKSRYKSLRYLMMCKQIHSR